MAKITHNVGSAANDGTGATLRQGFIDQNSMNTELYNAVAALEAVAATPCMGTKYDEFRAAVKYFVTTELFIGDLYFVSKIENGVGGHVIVEVSKTSTLSTAGSVVMKSDRTTTARTGWEIVALSAYGGSGLYANLIIDWDELTAAVSYTCATWPEGGLYVVNQVKAGTTGGGGTENALIVDADLTDVDGSKDQYIITAAEDISLTMKPFASMKGTVKINNISAYNAELFADASETSAKFNDSSQMSVIVEPGDYVEVMAYSSQVFYVKGPFTNPA